MKLTTLRTKSKDSRKITLHCRLITTLHLSRIKNCLLIIRTWVKTWPWPTECAMTLRPNLLTSLSSTTCSNRGSMNVINWWVPSVESTKKNKKDSIFQKRNAMNSKYKKLLLKSKMKFTDANFWTKLMLKMNSWQQKRIPEKCGSIDMSSSRKNM